MVGRISAHPPELLNPICDDVPMANSAPNAAMGAMKRPGKYAPRANPAEVNAATPTPAAATGHHGGAPQAMDRPRSPSVTAMKTRYDPTAQTTVAAQVASWASQRGRTVAVTRSVMPRLPSREPIQAATPATNGAKSTRA